MSAVLTPIYSVCIWDAAAGLFLTPMEEEVRRLEPIHERYYEDVPREYLAPAALKRARWWEAQGKRVSVKHYGWQQRGFRPDDTKLPLLYSTAA